ncbi:unnamed protein product [Durusdinium trenchii]|uniref:Rieske domain-containing protein n=1 Tax=Durusdinium trenchii TaxID=1381693 RepID=A0ABP0IUF9_9DINO
MAGEDEWHLILNTDELAAVPSKPTMKVLQIESTDILLMMGHGKYYALDARCGHRGGPLHEGDLEDLGSTGSSLGLCVRCPWHGRRFQAETGIEVGKDDVLLAPMQRCHELRLDGRGLHVRLTNEGHYASERQSKRKQKRQPKN